MRPLLMVVALAAGGCTATDPLYRAGLWHPTHANDANLLAMIADPGDLVNGAANPVADGGTAAEAVARYRDGKVKVLPASGIARFATTGASSGGAAAAAAGAN